MTPPPARPTFCATCRVTLFARHVATNPAVSLHDFTAASKLAGRMSSSMQVGSVAFSLSPETQHNAEQKLVTQAIDPFRKQAQTAAQAFDYSNFTIREVNLGRGGMQPRPVMMISYPQ